VLFQPSDLKKFRAGLEGLWRYKSEALRLTKDITLDVSPSVEGFFRVPPIWVGDTPEPATFEALNLTIHHETAPASSLTVSLGVIRRVQ
jgi:hypothetical protein